MCLQFFRHRESRSRICQSAHYTRILLLYTIPLLTWSQISSSPVSPGLQDGRSGYTVQYCYQHIRPDVCCHFATYTKLKLSFRTHWNLPQSYLSDQGDQTAMFCPELISFSASAFSLLTSSSLLLFLICMTSLHLLLPKYALNKPPYQLYTPSSLLLWYVTFTILISSFHGICGTGTPAVYISSSIIENDLESIFK